MSPPPNYWWMIAWRDRSGRWRPYISESFDSRRDARERIRWMNLVRELRARKVAFAD